MPRSFFKFLLWGADSLSDSGLRLGLIKLGLSPLLARPPAILAAMISTWLANKRQTFNVSKARSIPEVARYSIGALLTALLNDFIYSGPGYGTSAIFLCHCCVNSV